MTDHQMQSSEMTLLRQLQLNGLVQMSPLGEWELSPKGRDFLDRIDLLRRLDKRPGAGRGSSPMAAGSPRATPGLSSGPGRKPGDDDRQARRRRAQATPKRGGTK